MKKTAYLYLIAAICAGFASCDRARVVSEREQRRDVEKGNALYADKNYGEAMRAYGDALDRNPGNPEAIFNRSLADVRLAASEKNDSVKQNLFDEAAEGWNKFANSPKSNPAVASKSAYNIGNINMDRKQYAEAITYYKAALRIDPADSVARRNLRIAQLNLQQQDKNQDQQNQDKQNKDKQDQNKDQQNKDKQDQNKDQQNKDKQDQQNKQQPQQNQAQPQQTKPISKAAADRLLQRSQNKENATRAKMMNQNNRRSREKNW